MLILVSFGRPGMETFGIFHDRLVLLGQFGAFYNHFVHIVVVWYIFSCFGMMDHEKSGSPGQDLIEATQARIAIEPRG
jgi:hypothetical protein